MITARAVAVTETLLLGAAGTVRAQAGSVSLLVIDDATDTAVSDVRVSIVGQAGEGVTDARGLFFYVVPRRGRVAFVMRRLGYRPGTLLVDVKAPDTTRVTFAMTAAPQTLATVSVSDTMTSASPFLSAFERRARVHAGSATYITRSQIDRAHASRVTDLLRRTTSLIVVDSADIQVVRSRRQGCTMQLAVDGQLRYRGFPVNTQSPEDIHGIEVYPGPATVPAEFASTKGKASCGLIMIWTRRDK
jgi:hypothetical protein